MVYFCNSKTILIMNYIWAMSWSWQTFNSSPRVTDNRAEPKSGGRSLEKDKRIFKSKWAQNISISSDWRYWIRLLDFHSAHIHLNWGYPIFLFFHMSPPHICHSSFTHIFRNLKFLHSQWINSRQICLATKNAKIKMSVEFHTECKITHHVKSLTLLNVK